MMNEQTKKIASGRGCKFITVDILSDIQVPCKVESKERCYEVQSLLRMRILALLNQLRMPCAIAIEDIARKLDEPTGGVSRALYGLKSYGQIDYKYVRGVGFIFKRVEQFFSPLECRYRFSHCDKDCLYLEMCKNGSMKKERGDECAE